MYKICVYVPVDYAEKVKQAMFNAGAGKIGNYDCCAWQILGTGQFRPLAGSDPFLGQQNQIETVLEYKIELVCAECYLQAVIAALKQAHPYETPAYQVWKVMEI